MVGKGLEFRLHPVAHMPGRGYLQCRARVGWAASDLLRPEERRWGTRFSSRPLSSPVSCDMSPQSQSPQTYMHQVIEWQACTASAGHCSTCIKARWYQHAPCKTSRCRLQWKL